MSSNYSSGKNSIADCDRCGFQFKLSQLKHIYIRLNDTNIKVCHECWEPDQPQNMQGMYPVDDPQAVRDPRPDLSFVPSGTYSSRDIQWGWNPVGFNNQLQLAGLIDDLEGTGAVGTVTVTTT